MAMTGKEKTKRNKYNPPQHKAKGTTTMKEGSGAEERTETAAYERAEDSAHDPKAGVYDSTKKSKKKGK